MKKRTAVLLGVVLAVAVFLLVFVESGAGRSFRRSVFSSPGITKMAWQFWGWGMVVFVPLLAVAQLASRSRQKVLHWCGVVGIWATIGLAVRAFSLFCWFLLDWGMSTNWTFRL